jgi:hydrogenase maturation protease
MQTVELSMNSRDIEREPARPARPPKVLVIGFGNPIRGDDALGPMAAERLEQVVSSDNVQVISRHVLTTELIAEVSEATLVIFLDAATDGPIGEVLCRPIFGDPQTAASMAHFFQPRELLAAARELYGNQPESFLVSVRGTSFDFAKYQLSPTVEGAMESLIAKVLNLIDEHLTHFGNLNFEF